MMLKQKKAKNKSLRTELENLKNDIKEKDKTIQQLNQEKQKLIKGCYTQEIVRNKNKELKKKNKEIADIKNKNINLIRFNRMYINSLYRRGYKPSGKNTDQLFIENFWSVAKTFKKEIENNKSNSI